MLYSILLGLVIYWAIGVFLLMIFDDPKPIEFFTLSWLWPIIVYKLIRWG